MKSVYNNTSLVLCIAVLIIAIVLISMVLSVRKMLVVKIFRVGQYNILYISNKIIAIRNENCYI